MLGVMANWVKCRGWGFVFGNQEGGTSRWLPPSDTFETAPCFTSVPAASASPCPSHVSFSILGALHIWVPGVPLQPSSSSFTQYPSWKTKPAWYQTSLFFSPHLSLLLPTLFVLLASVCISYSKLNPQLKWKSSQHPSGFRAITSCS